MSSLSQPEPAPPAPILTDIRAPGGARVATLARAPGSTSALLRDAEGRLRARLTGEREALWREAVRYINQHPDYFQPEREDAVCPVDPQRP